MYTIVCWRYLLDVLSSLFQSNVLLGSGSLVILLKLYTFSLKPHHIFSRSRSLARSEIISSFFFFLCFFSRSSLLCLRLAIHTRHWTRAFWKKTDTKEEKKKERETDDDDDECSSTKKRWFGENSLTLCSLSVCMYSSLFFSLFNKNFLYVRNHNKRGREREKAVHEDDDDDEN